MSESTPLPLQFQLLFNWDASANHDELLKNKTRMFPAFQCVLNNVPIYCLTDYDLGSHFISAGQLWKACGLTITEGLFLFELKPSDYQVDFLMPHFPFCDVWVSVTHARRMASILGVHDALSQLLYLDSQVFSSDNVARNEIVHNWTVDAIPSAMYSTRALLETTFDNVELLGQRKIRTQIARTRQAGVVMKDRLETGLVRWQLDAYEKFLEGQSRHEPAEEAPEDSRHVSNAVWDVLQGLYCDLRDKNHNIRTNVRVLSDSMMVGNMPLKREYLGQGVLLQQIYVAVMAEKLYHEIHRPADPPLDTRPTLETTDKEDIGPPRNNDSASLTSPTDGEALVASSMLVHDRMDALEQELYKMKRKAKRKIDASQLKLQELEQQLVLLEHWKLSSERARKSERMWILMVTLSILIGIWALGSH